MQVSYDVNKFYIILKVVIVCLCYAICVNSKEDDIQFCTKTSKTKLANDCQISKRLLKVPRYILYDVNPPEGFNLRRDVYMRMAIFVSKLPKSDDWHLVLPPWGPLYHWQSKNVGQQSRLQWGLFFDIQSLYKFVPVIEFYNFLNDQQSTVIEQVFVLQHFKDAFTKNYNWEEKYEIEPCLKEIPYTLESNGQYSSRFWGYSNVTAVSVKCLSFHGHASQLGEVASNFTAVMFDHAEVVLHDTFTDALYWRARRSMRFAQHLREIADEFRIRYFNSTDEKDGTVMPDSWTEEKGHRSAKGGDYLCVHLRRQDFVWARPQDVPSIPSAASQIKKHLERLQLSNVFIATDDANNPEIEKMIEEYLLSELQVVLYEPTQIVRETFKDGGIAIIEQIICSHARYFLGTHESTFSFRIQEEREILGFPNNSTFNRLCGDDDKKCKQPTQWKIVY